MRAALPEAPSTPHVLTDRRRPVNFCGRCDEPIRPGEQYTTHDILSPSAGGATVYRHVELCKKVPIQTTQASVRH